MRHRLIPALIAGLLAGLAASVPPAGAEPLGTVERNQTAFSAALGRPLIYNVYRPAEPPPPGRRWPVVYLLEGRPSESDWLDQGDVGEVVDRAVREGAIPPTLVVIPVAPFSWYVDNVDPGGAGMMATALSRDLVAAVDARYPTARCREARAVGGLSMGGYGAASFALRRPDQYVAAMSFAGAIAPEIGPAETDRLRRADAFYDGAFGRPLDRRRFNAWSIFAALRRSADLPGERPAMYLAVGDRDRGGLLQTATKLHVDLLRAGHDSTLRIGPGGHDWDTWRRQLREAFDWLGPRLDPSCGSVSAEVEGRAEGDPETPRP